MSLKSSNKIETNVYELEVSIPAEEFSKEATAVFNRKKSKIALPGWRKGKAPRSMIEAVYGKNVFYEEALENLFPKAADEAIKEAGLIAVDSPNDVDVKEIGENGVEFTMKITVKPEITLTSYKGIEASKDTVEVTDEEVQEELDRMIERGARFVTVDDRAAKEGDTTVIDFEGFIDGVAFEGGKGENYSLILGSNHFVPGFEDQVAGHNLNEEFDVNVKLPEEYPEELAGKDAVFKVKINEIKEKQLPELDDEFAKDMGEYDTVEELKAGISADILQHKTDSVNAQFEDDVLKVLCENVEGEIPDVMFRKKADDNKSMFEHRVSHQGIDIDTYLMYMGVDKTQYDKDMYDQAVSQVKVRLALEKIVELENIEVTEDEMNEEYKKLAERYGVPEDDAKKYFAEEDVKSDLSCEKAVKFVVDNAVIVEKPVEEEKEESSDEGAEE